MKILSNFITLISIILAIYYEFLFSEYKSMLQTTRTLNELQEYYIDNFCIRRIDIKGE